jgi:hypothetical protein
VYDLGGGGDSGEAMEKAEEALAAAEAAQTTADGAATAAGNAQTAADAALAKGLPAGGPSGQVLAKASGTDYDTEWIDPPGKLVPLWENASPTSAFQSQTITVQGASAYDFLVFVYYADNKATTVLPVCLCPKGSGAYVTGGFSGTMCRRYSTVSGDNIWFSTANQVSGTAPSNLQNAIIPWMIYGFNLN